ncbi:ABC transporter ATP-binding protein [Magnetospirillum sp. 15-1]|uniref:ABC transporter ATP-binding protein n=1 Tax=Magnetospirillum sp. 15-1 TaxID=1979370 RepID=UPI000BBCB1D3|nr:ABC transporter ATP-binding protein [Magnetospirillum sp. 15-1]
MSVSPFLFETRDLTKAFGGLIAVNSVSIGFREREAHAIIGPNGAGKSTFVNLLTGHLPASGGHVMFKGADITRQPAHKVARLGIGRSYQKTNVFPTFTCFENCRLAAQSHLATSMRFLRPAASYREISAKASEALERAGLASWAGRIAGTMSYGEQRQLEIAMVLATAPQVLVLDEPLAGMGKEESEGMVGLLQELAQAYTLILIEHDMDAVFAIAKVLSVMVNGTLLESGPLDQIRASKAVQDAYLGDGAEAY